MCMYVVHDVHQPHVSSNNGCLFFCSPSPVALTPCTGVTVPIPFPPVPDDTCDPAAGPAPVPDGTCDPDPDAANSSPAPILNSGGTPARLNGFVFLFKTKNLTRSRVAMESSMEEWPEDPPPDWMVRSRCSRVLFVGCQSFT